MDLRRGIGRMARRLFAPAEALRERYQAFRKLLKSDDACLGAMAELEDIAHGEEEADWERAVLLCRRVAKFARAAAALLPQVTERPEDALLARAEALGRELAPLLPLSIPDPTPPYIVPLDAAARKPHLYGGKAAALGAVRAAGLPAPPGLAVSVGAWRYVLEYNGLGPKIAALLSQAALSRPGKLSRLCRRMRELVLAADVPPPLEEELGRAVAGLAAEGFPGRGLLAVRSSAVAEDGELSFAGQYESLLNISPGDAAQAFKTVLAGKYRVKAVSYRIHHGLADAETPMAVLILPMVEAAASGVLYSLDPGFRENGRRAVGVYAVRGLAEGLVGGKAAPSRRYLTRSDPPELLVAEDEPGGPDLSGEELSRLSRLGLTLESLFRAPQDVEWAMDASGRIFILQSRPISPERNAVSGSEETPPPDLSGETALLDGGLRVSGGAAAGRIFHAESLFDPEAVPKGAILCVSALPPSLSRVAGVVGAVVAEAGSRAGHFASIAREYGLPVLVGARDACRLLPEGAAVTVDADSGAVFAGRVEQVLAGRPKTREKIATPMTKRLAAIMPLVSPLTLLDPESPDFTPEKAVSLHDVVRYAHEKCVAAMFSLADGAGRGMGRAKKIATPLPVSAYVLDLGGGLAPEARDKSAVGPSEIASPPLRALWQGLEGEEAHWEPGMIHMDWEAFDRVSAGVMSREPRELATHAMAGKEYAHLLLRFGYHFAVADAWCGEEVKNNYAAFRFKGGGGTPDLRRARLVFIDRILTLAGFETIRAGDMLEARFARRGPEETLGRLALLGAVMARTRLMDATMESGTDVDALARAFLEGRTLSLSEASL
jgi:pyruvate, water dikinase